MNFQQLKAKYANGAAATSSKVTSSVSDVASKTWGATKSAAVSTSSYVKGIAPATNRRVNAIATELNSQLNNQEKEMFKQRVLIEMLAQQAGVNLPTDELLEQYWEAGQDQAAQPQVEERRETVGHIETPATEEKKVEIDPDYTPEQREFIESALEEANSQEDEPEVIDPEEQHSEDAPASKQGRRRLGRQQPLAE